MPRHKPDQLPKELQPLLEAIRPPQRYYRMNRDVKPPSDIYQTLMEAAFVCPRIMDLAAFYWVTEQTFMNWRKADPKLDVIIAQAKQADVQEVLAAVRKKAVVNKDVSAARLYLQATRPELIAPESAVQVNVKNNTVNVLPAPKQKLERPKLSVIDLAPASDEDRIPLFSDSPRPTPAGPPATGLQRG